MTDSAAAVADLPRHREAGRLKVESCCSFQLGHDARTKQLQGIDSAVHDASGPNYTLRVIFGPYDGAQPHFYHHLAGQRMVDEVELAAFYRTDRDRKPSEGRLLWLADVGGGRINGINHGPWGLRIHR